MNKSISYDKKSQFEQNLLFKKGMLKMLLNSATEDVRKFQNGHPEIDNSLEEARCVGIRDGLRMALGLMEID